MPRALVMLFIRKQLFESPHATAAPYPDCIQTFQQVMFLGPLPPGFPISFPWPATSCTCIFPNPLWAKTPGAGVDPPRFPVLFTGDVHSRRTHSCVNRQAGGREYRSIHHRARQFLRTGASVPLFHSERANYRCSSRHTSGSLRRTPLPHRSSYAPVGVRIAIQTARALVRARATLVSSEEVLSHAGESHKEYTESAQHILFRSGIEHAGCAAQPACPSSHTGAASLSCPCPLVQATNPVCSGPLTRATLLDCPINSPGL